jgi:hypothetical protein
MRRVVSFLAGVLVSAVSAAQSSDIPVSNWTVPPYTQSYTGGLTTMTDFTPPRAFIGVVPCRIVDTRSGAFPAGFGPPNLAPGVERVFDILNGPCPGLSGDVVAYSFNVTAVTPSGPGHLIVWPTGGAAPDVSSINYTAGQTIANAVIVPAGNGFPNKAVSVKAGVSGTHLLIDINGYFSATSTSNSSFRVENNSGSVTASFTNLSTGCTGACAVQAVSVTNSSGRAISGQVVFGGNTSAGVYGHQGSFVPLGTYSGAGVRGEGTGYGVLGISTSEAVTGDLVNGSGASLAYGSLGSAFGTDPNCIGGGSCGGPWGVFAGGNIGATGLKHFLDPHPTDPNLVIAYVSLEGPEAGTYFRGRGRILNGIARIAVPEHFRLVTDPEGLTVQITPIGPMASFSVVKYDLDEIVVQSSRNVEFFYMVNGVRAAFKDVVPFRPGNEFAPRSADARMPEWLSPAQKRLLIQNGTYRPDGTVNMETAHRLGWDSVWAERNTPRPELAP